MDVYTRAELYTCPAQRAAGRALLYSKHGPVKSAMSGGPPVISNLPWLGVASAVGACLLKPRRRTVKVPLHGPKFPALVTLGGLPRRASQQLTSHNLEWFDEWLENRERKADKKKKRRENQKVKKEKKDKMERLLRAARSGTESGSYAVLVWTVLDQGVVFPARDFAKLMRALMIRSPIQEDLVRFMLNMALPAGSQPLPLFEQSTKSGSDLNLLIKREISQCDPTILFGHVRAANDAALRFFSVHVISLHLDTIAQIRAVEEELKLPSAEQKDIGYTLGHLRVQSISSTRKKGKKGKIGQCICFAPPSNEHGAWNANLRSGDTVMLSRSNPLHDGISAIGNLGVDESASLLYLTTNREDGLIDTRGAEQGTWCLHKIQHWSTYTRQLQALSTIVDRPQTNPLWRIIVSSGSEYEDEGSWPSKLHADRQLVGSSDASHGQERSDSSAGRASACEWEEVGAEAHDFFRRGLQRLERAEILYNVKKQRLELQRKQRLELQRAASIAPSLPHEEAQRLQGLLKAVLPNGPLACEVLDCELDDAQLDALMSALTGQLTLIQGPPGTGKTHVSAQLLKLLTRIFSPVLAVSDSNVAVDNLAMAAHNMGMKTIRIGNIERIRPDTRSISLESMVAPDLSSAQKNKLMRKIISTAEVICMTNCKAGSALVRNSRIDVKAILVDEAAQATELSTLVPIVSCPPRQLILVGDHCQLPPTVMSQDAKARGLSLSLFSRLVAQGLTPHTLQKQRRMHPKLAEFSSQHFYHGLLTTAVESSSRMPPEGFDWPRPDAGIAFIDSSGSEVPIGTSWVNGQEVSIVADVLSGFLDAKSLSARDVGIVSPYSAQVRRLSRVLLRTVAAGIRELEINTVDGFQGSEKELIIFSVVRSNRYGVGFLSDWRRINVMLTRARRGLVVIGNAATLKLDPIWAKWLAWVRKNKFIVSQR